MKLFLLLSFAILLSPLVGPVVQTQSVYTTANFLNISTSANGNGWGEISSSMISNSTTAFIQNPAQLGAQSSENHVAFEFSLFTKGRCSSASAGVNLARDFDLTIPVSFGIGYSRYSLDDGATSIGLPGGVPSQRATDEAEIFSIGVGMDYWGTLALGINLKDVISNSFPDSRTRFTAIDVGMLLVVPIADLVSRVRGKSIVVLGDLSPLINISAGYAHRNHADEVTYLRGSYRLPREVQLGLGVELGFTTVPF